MAVEIPIPLIDLIRNDIGEPDKSGRQPAWRCPFPDHDDRTPSLKLTPDGKRFRCWGCDRKGDAVDWVMMRQGLPFQDAVKFLNGRMAENWKYSPPPQPKPPTVRKREQPHEDFSRRAGRVVDDCVSALWSTSGDKPRQWLLDRGLKEETIRRHHLGFSSQRGNRHGLFVFKGVTIPWEYRGRIIAIKVRQFNADGKYKWVAGGRRVGVYPGGSIRPTVPTVIVEGEFDALIAIQEIGDLINVATLGSQSDPPDQDALIQLIGSPALLICYDNDGPGKRGAGRWLQSSERARLISLPKGKDINELHLLGGDLRAWIEEIVHDLDTKLTRHPTIGLNDKQNKELSVG